MSGLVEKPWHTDRSATLDMRSKTCRFTESSPRCVRLVESIRYVSGAKEYGNGELRKMACSPVRWKASRRYILHHECASAGQDHLLAV